jgi:hypothetical protein
MERVGLLAWVALAGIAICVIVLAVAAILGIVERRRRSRRHFGDVAPVAEGASILPPGSGVRSAEGCSGVA